MALIFAESFDHYATTSSNSTDRSSVIGSGNNWETVTAPNLITIQTGRYAGSFAVSMNADLLSGEGRLETTPNIYGTEFIIGFNAKQNADNTSSAIDVIWNKTVDHRVRIFGDGALELYINSGLEATLTWNTLGPASDWHNIEIEYVANVLNIYSADTLLHTSGPLAPMDTLALSAPANLSLTPTPLIDDLYVIDTSGPAANTRLGSKARLENIQPNASTVQNDWEDEAAGTTNTFNSVDEIPENDTDFITATTPGHATAYGYPNLATNRVVHGLYLKRRVSTTTIGAVELADIVLDGADSPTKIAPTFVPPATTTTLYKVSHINPVTGLAWTLSDIQGIRYGVQLDLLVTSSSSSSFSSSGSSSQSSTSSSSSSSSSSQSSSSLSSSQSSSSLSSSQSSSSQIIVAAAYQIGVDVIVLPGFFDGALSSSSSSSQSSSSSSQSSSSSSRSSSSSSRSSSSSSRSSSQSSSSSRSSSQSSSSSSRSSSSQSSISSSQSSSSSSRSSSSGGAVGSSSSVTPCSGSAPHMIITVAGNSWAGLSVGTHIVCPTTYGKGKTGFYSGNYTSITYNATYENWFLTSGSDFLQVQAKRKMQYYPVTTPTFTFTKAVYSYVSIVKPPGSNDQYTIGPYTVYDPSITTTIPGNVTGYIKNRLFGAYTVGGPGSPSTITIQRYGDWPSNP